MHDNTHYVMLQPLSLLSFHQLSFISCCFKRAVHLCLCCSQLSAQLLLPLMLSSSWT